MNEFVTHTPITELRSNPLFLRTPSSLEKKKTSLPQVPRQQVPSKVLLQKLNEKPQTTTSPRKAKTLQPQKTLPINPALKSNSPYRKHNIYKAQMPVKTSSPQQRPVSLQSQPAKISRNSFDDEPNFDVKKAPEIMQQSQLPPTQKVDFYTRYEQDPIMAYISPKREIQLSDYCDYDEQAGNDIPFSGSIKIARIIRSRQQEVQQEDFEALESGRDKYCKYDNIIIGEKSLKLEEVELSDKSDFNAPDEEYEVIDGDFDQFG